MKAPWLTVTGKGAQGAVAEVVKHDPRTGTTELRNTGTGTVQTIESHNNTLYVAVREAE